MSAQKKTGFNMGISSVNTTKRPASLRL